MSDNESESVFLYHEECPKCGSKDNLGRFSDGHAYCFGCGHREPSDALYVPPKGIKLNKGDKPLFPKGAYEDLPNWNIKEETCRKFGYSRSPYGGGCHIAAIRDKDGLITAQKVRYFTPKKMFSWRGNKSDKCQLFGQHLWTTKSGPKLVITEGEKDCLAVAQNSNNKWPVVSVLNGAGGAEKDCKDNLQWLMQFKEIILLFDMDKAGQEAAIKVAQLFPPNKVKIAKLPRNDAFDCWKAKEGHLITLAIFQAEPYRPVAIYTASDMLGEAVTLPSMGHAYPWKELTEASFGRHEGNVITIAAAVGGGKSTFLHQMIENDVFELDLPVAVFASEAHPAETLQSVASMRADKILTKPDGDLEELRKYASEVAKKPLYLYNPAELFEWDNIKDTMRYLVLSAGVKIIYIDNLTSMTSHETDVNTALRVVMKEMCLFAQEHKVVIHVVSHLVKPERGDHESGGDVTLRQLYGSSAIAQWSHTALALIRNQQHEDPIERRVMTVKFIKHRMVGANANGRRFKIIYDLETGKYGNMEDTEAGALRPIEESTY